MHAVGHQDLNFNSPKSFDGQQFPDIEKDLYLESLSNGDLSRVDATSMQRSFTNLQHQHPRSTIGMRENIIRKTTSESGFPQKALEKDLSPDFFDQLADAEQFKTKGDAFYQNNKYEQAFKVYEIARDLVNDYCTDNEEKVHPDGANYIRVSQLRLTIVMALVESAFQLGWYEEAIVFCREGIETNTGIARLHHMLAKSILGLSDSLNK